LYVADKGALEDVEVANVRAWEAQWHDYAAANIPDVLKSIADSGELSDDDKAKLDEAVAGFKQTVSL
jgi:F-type H+-transporting ATPase subunit alpha